MQNQFSAQCEQCNAQIDVREAYNRIIDGGAKRVCKECADHQDNKDDHIQSEILLDSLSEAREIELNGKHYICNTKKTKK